MRPVREPVMVVGGGISGVACARELTAAGLPVVVWDRSRRVGGRLASRTVSNRPVDVGASYFTVSDPAFAAVVESWRARGLARAWTDTFAVAGPEGLREWARGPLRYAAPRGLRVLVEDLADGLYVEHGVDVESVDRVDGRLRLDGSPAAAVVLAMPDQQAADLLGAGLQQEADLVADQEWLPSLALYARWEERSWPETDGVFVHDSGVLSWIADDGRRRGDGLPVLVAHATAGFAASRLDRPEDGLQPMLDELAGVLGVRGEPRWAGMTRWSLSSPAAARKRPYHLGRSGVGLCGDGWGGKPRVEAAFLSGRALGQALAARLG
ncbi:MAG: FAD-dependent oxidoreductase [Actinomycetota bacterium]|nr:FAD-dependent oxidoreductase [Actinomycetota bacterium]